MKFGYWDETITVWHRQGLPLEVKTSEDYELVPGWLKAGLNCMFPIEAAENYLYYLERKKEIL
jgi:hypothetical protein